MCGLVWLTGVTRIQTQGLRLAVGSELTGHHDVVSSVAPLTGNKIVSSSWDMTSRVYDTFTGQSVAVFDAHCAAITSSASAPDARGTFATASASDAEVLLWSESQADATARFTTAVEPTCVTWRDQVTLFVGLASGAIAQYDVRNLAAPVHSERRHTRSVRRIVATASGAASGADDCAVLTWSWTGVGASTALRPHTDFVRALLWVPERKQLISGSLDKTIVTHTLQ